jgi:hypothetical protein
VPTASIVFCDRCGSERVDVASLSQGSVREFRFRCYECKAESDILGFTIGRAETPEPSVKEARAGRAGSQTMKMPRLER